MILLIIIFLLFQVLTAFVEEFCPEKREALAGISLSRQSVTRRIETLSQDIEQSVKSRASNFVYFSIALDESTDNSDTAQLAIMVRGVDEDFNVTEDLLTLGNLHSTTTGRDVFDELFCHLQDFNLPLERLSGVCTDGAPAMAGTQNGLVGLLLKSRVWDMPPYIYHCIVHQENLAAQTLKMNHVMNLVVSTVNFIRSRALNHRQFQEMLLEINSEFTDVTYYCKVRWLSSAKTLRRFYNLLNEINTFMRSKGREHDEFTDKQWINDLAFLADVTEHMSSLNLQLQGKNQHIGILWQHVSAFRNKLLLWKQQFNEGTCPHFKTLEGRIKTDHPVDLTQYAEVLSGLHEEFVRRFHQFDDTEVLIKIFHDPFNINPQRAPVDLQLELVELSCDERMKQHHNNHELIAFYHDFLPKNTYPAIYKHALRMVSLFGSTYLCEQFFSKMKYTKNKYRTVMTDTHLMQQLRLATSSTKPDIDRIVKNSQYQVSH